MIEPPEFKPRNASPLEREAILWLRDRFQEQQNVGISYSDFSAALKIPHEQAGPLIVRLVHLGAVGRTAFGMLYVATHVVDLAGDVMEFDKAQAEPRDVIDSIKLTVRRKPVAALMLLVVAGIMAAIPFLNQLLELLIKIGWMNPRKP